MGFWTQMLEYVAAATIFSVLGIAIMGGCYWLMTHFFPFSIVKEIEQDQNTALAIIIGSVLIGMAIIIPSAIYGFAPS